MWKYCRKQVKKETFAMVTGKGKHDGRALFRCLLHKTPKFSAYATIIIIIGRFSAILSGISLPYNQLCLNR